jgi:hypothetical protein
MMGRLNELGGLAHDLLARVSANVPLPVYRCVLAGGPAWMDHCTNLLPFLRDAREVDGELVDIFIKSVRSVQRILHHVVVHVRQSQSELQKLLPKMSTALSLWTYTLKSTFAGIYDDGAGLRVGALKERRSQESD